ncbi:serine/arginine repetitive matrix protein 4 isoform X2 [Siniperca chuatsi]|uniref:serine/arginine repetitive matrix protein 4 isoform X2 n=1 Tax=Siniperca chuatsi TaxID=119488 RepID=UPI001CE080D5|nr:serine/arginine repetitive matrix protein 4 isoform X2 [Siniperca chuatsi]
MQPPCSLQLGPSGPSPSLGLQGSTAGFHQLEEKQLFEKFWKGTFKAVATPRPESVIVASITAHRRVTNSETAACQPLKTDERKAAETRVDTSDRNGCIKGKGRKHHSHRRARSPSFDEELSPRPKGKKKKRKSERKRKRKRSPSHSLSPLRKKKKKKKKSSKKSKRHRYTSKKSKHSSSSLKHKRKDERKHKKSSRTHSRRRRRYRRHHLQKSVVHQALGDLAAVVEETNGVLDHTDMKWRPATKSVCKTAPKYRSILSTATILSSKPGSELLHRKGSQHLLSQTEGPHDYDSGNDTSSPPSSKTGVSRASVTDNKRNHCKRLASPEKMKFTDRDNVSDSGNSVTSYASLCKPYVEDGLSATLFSGNGKREQITLGCRVEVVRSPKTSSCSQKMSKSSRRRLKTRSSSSRSRSRSSGSSRYSGRYSRSLSLSSCSTYSRSPSYSADLRRRGSVASLSSRGSYSRYSADRLRDRKRTTSSRETDVKPAHKVSGKRRRRKSYSPMKKRRRDSPSHLEARRITSARKRPIPYFRPSPSSTSRSTSVSSWSSLFTRSRSRSPVRGISRSRSRSRSHSFSSYRSYSRSSSWNSIFGTRSRSRSRGSLNKRNKTRH